MQPLHEQLGEAYFAQLQLVANQNKHHYRQVSSLTSPRSTLTSPTNGSTISDIGSRKKCEEFQTPSNVPTLSGLEHNASTKSTKATTQTAQCSHTENSRISPKPTRSRLPFDVQSPVTGSHPEFISHTITCDAAAKPTGDNASAAKFKGLRKITQTASPTMKSPVYKHVLQVPAKTQNAKEKQFAFVKATLAKLKITQTSEIAVSSSESVNKGLSGLDTPSTGASNGLTSDTPDQSIGQIKSQSQSKGPFHDSESDRSISASLDDPEVEKHVTVTSTAAVSEKEPSTPALNAQYFEQARNRQHASPKLPGLSASIHADSSIKKYITLQGANPSLRHKTDAVSANHAAQDVDSQSSSCTSKTVEWAKVIATSSSTKYENSPSSLKHFSISSPSLTYEKTAKAPLQIKHTPQGLVEHLLRAGLIPSQNRKIFKSHKGKDPAYVYEQYLLDDLKGSSPYEAFDTAARFMKAAKRSHIDTVDSAIVPGSKFNYDLPSWVSPMNGRFYIWKCARNLRLGLQPLTKSEYDNLFSRNSRQTKTYRDLEADEAFRRGEWDVVAEMRKPENRDAILEHERQLNERTEVHDIALFKYEEYTVPQTFKMRTIQSQPLTTLEHQIASNMKMEDLPPKDHLRLDIDCFVKAEHLTQINMFDAVENKYPECRIPVFPIWKYESRLQAVRDDKNQSVSTQIKAERGHGQGLPLLDAPPIYWNERPHADLSWTTKIQKPRTNADLNTHGCYLYMNPDNVEVLDKWLNDVVSLALNNPCYIDVTSSEYKSGRFPATGLVRPYYHYPDELFGESTESFYAPPNQEPDFDEIVYEEDKGFDPIQSHDEQMPWGVDHSIACECRLYINFLCQQYKLLKVRDGLQEMDKDKSSEETFPHKSVPLVDPGLDPLFPNPASNITPEISMYVRPAAEQDVEAFLEIYNHWSKTSTTIPSRAIHGQPLFDHILSTTSYHELPCFVACSSKTSSLKRNTRSDTYPRENVIGVSYALPWSSEAAFAQTYELFIFSSPNESLQRNGLANVLLDRLMAGLDQYYVPQFPTRCYDSGLDARHFQPGGLRGSAVARKLLANIYYTDPNINSMLWKKDWLTKWGWKIGAMISDIGNGKDGGSLHLLTMSYDVGSGGERGRNHIKGETWEQWGVAGNV